LQGIAFCIKESIHKQFTQGQEKPDVGSFDPTKQGKGSVAQLVEQGIENSFWPVFTVLLGLSKPLFFGNKEARGKFGIG
jgi:hypothetical protein